jgi:alkanesulfonate monooxygenase SsuD/methylene tetrahydromethanopterin reductase-like flavin-dependent oxidoreductase (luciferase family)
MRFAEECAVLDILSGGRLEMAVAIGYRRREAEAYGVDFSTRGRRTDELLGIVQRLWAGETVTHESAFYSLKNATISPRPLRDKVSLYMGGFNEKALDRIAKYADGYLGNLDVVDVYLDKLRLHGKNPADAKRRIQGLITVVANDPEKAMHELAPYFHHVNNSYGQWLNEDQASTGLAAAAALKPMTLQQFKASGILQILTPGQAIDMLNALRAKAPMEHFMMMLPPGLAPEKFTEYASLLAAEVIPAFR